MNDSQAKVKDYMDGRITELKMGLENLQLRDQQPTNIGDLYNGMLKNTVNFEIQHMQKLREELLDVLGE